MNSEKDIDRQARRALQAVQRLLDPAVTGQLIDLPIQAALRDFRFAYPDRPTPAATHRVLGKFVHLLWRKFAGNPAFRTMDTCVDVAVALLKLYPGPCGDGYDNAMMELAEPPPYARAGIDHLLITLAEVVRAQLLEQYTAYAWARWLTCQPGPVRRAMARQLVRNPVFSRCVELREQPAYELVGALPELYTAVRDAKMVKP